MFGTDLTRTTPNMTIPLNATDTILHLPSMPQTAHLLRNHQQLVQLARSLDTPVFEHNYLVGALQDGYIAQEFKVLAFDIFHKAKFRQFEQNVAHIALGLVQQVRDMLNSAPAV